MVKRYEELSNICCEAADITSEYLLRVTVFPLVTAIDANVINLRARKLLQKVLQNCACRLVLR
jgi:hypothetical protein